MSVKLNNEDVTEQVQITYNETMDGFDIDTGITLTEDDTLVVTYRAKVLPEAGDVELMNTAGVSCSNNPEWKYDSVPFIPEKKVPKLAIEKTSDKEVYQVGDTGHYTVHRYPDNRRHDCKAGRDQRCPAGGRRKDPSGHH